ncbi:MAG: phosphatidate cytidylyltransferase [Planctomycetota bacterium]|jgi:phosphatidate cytidylyltransferase
MAWLEDLLQLASDLVALPVRSVIVLVGIYATLVIGSIARLSHLHALPPAQAASLRVRLRTWWIIAIVLTLVILLGRPAIVTFVGLVSLLALREYLALVHDREHYGRVVWWAYAAVPLQYLWIYLGWYELFIIFIPVIASLVLTTRIVLMRHPEGFVHMVGTLHWGMMMLVFCLSHVAALLVLPAESNPVGGAVGWFLYLVILTEFNDIAQAVWGRALGRHAVIPAVSPGKSWEGLVGGVVCTIALALLLAPLLTPLAGSPPAFLGNPAPWYLSPWAALAGLLVAVGGFLGDITMSAVKRDVHVKDSGTLLPGQGGILDRIDSLTFTAPILFHYVSFLYD